MIELSAEEFKKQLRKPNVFLIDARTQEEYDNGHIENAILIPYDQVTPAKLKTLGISTDNEILLYCESGGRSNYACGVLEREGFNNINNLDGGLMVWSDAGYELV